MKTLSAEEFATIALERTHGGPVARITLRGGKGNILTGAMMRDIRAALATAIDDRDVKLLLITADGRDFSFGASVEEHRREEAAAMLREFHGMILDLVRCDLPIVSCVSGRCLGGALELVLAGSLLFADATAVFGQPEIVLGVFAPPASVLLPLRLGFARAEELLITGETITAARAHEIGLVNRLFETAEAMREGADAWIERHILPRSASSLRYAVRAERLPMVVRVSEMLPQLERLYVDDLMATHDAGEGIEAFLEKRLPVWING